MDDSAWIHMIMEGVSIATGMGLSATALGRRVRSIETVQEAQGKALAGIQTRLERCPCGMELMQPTTDLKVTE